MTQRALLIILALCAGMLTAVGTHLLNDTTDNATYHQLSVVE